MISQSRRSTSGSAWRSGRQKVAAIAATPRWSLTGWAAAGERAIGIDGGEGGFDLRGRPVDDGLQRFAHAALVGEVCVRGRWG